MSSTSRHIRHGGKRHRAVAAHLEDVAASALTSDADAIKHVLQRQHGVYALYRRGKLYYSGLASNLFSRIRQHTRDRHRRKWDRFSAYVTLREEQVRELESLLLRILRPEGNRVRGRLKGSQDLNREVGAFIAQQFTRHAAEVLGGRWLSKAKQHAVRNSRGARQLATISGKWRRLIGKYKGVEYTATLRKDGRIRYRKKLYESLHLAARAAAGIPRNGWGFWRYDAGRGNWKRLVALRR